MDDPRTKTFLSLSTITDARVKLSVDFMSLRITERLPPQDMLLSHTVDTNYITDLRPAVPLTVLSTRRSPRLIEIIVIFNENISQMRDHKKLGID